MSVVVLSPDLLLSSRIAVAAEAAGREVRRVEAPADLPPPASVHLLLVDWENRGPSWGAELAAWAASGPGRRPRIVLYGPHTDLVAHAAARESGLGPMWARSKLVSSLTELVSDALQPAADSEAQ